ncbi:MAG: hypothetical protein Q9182_002966 [Xanthomendoza sp. 2 TL-2023]
MSAPDDRSESSDDVLEPNSLGDEDDWKDVEPEDFASSYVSFGGKTKFSTLQDFLRDAKDNHGVDLVDLRDRYELETYGMIKLINYAREQVSQGLYRPDASPQDFLEGDRYMKPFMEDDALLYSVDDIFDVTTQQAHDLMNGSVSKSVNQTLCSEEVQDLLKQNEQLREQVLYYRKAYQESYLKTLEPESNVNRPSQQSADGACSAVPVKENDYDSHYFTSYDHFGQLLSHKSKKAGCMLMGVEIHETMLKDSVRTDAYRDFIYDNKNLFAGKVVLDVGCGTGILSLFCAKAGAARVIAVDNSSIIDKAREIVFANGLSDTIQCLRGKIEEVTLPVKAVDIIVSEWMGYCLLYEAMLDSVIWARNRYLVPDGLMVPSHAALRLSLFADEDYFREKGSFWNSVYGFDMSCMPIKSYDDIVVATVGSEGVPSGAETFLELPLHTILRDDLTINGINFNLTANREIDRLHGFVIYFDIAFAANRQHEMGNAKVGFTTGPSGRETHWQQALALIGSSKNKPAGLKSGEQVHGSVALRKGVDNPRELEISLTWQVGSSTSDSKPTSSTSRQTWLMH